MRISLSLICYLMSVFCIGQLNCDLNGIVEDGHGGGLPGAHVVFKNTQQTYTAVTDKEGKFEFTKVPFGSYQLHVSFLSYQPFTDQIDLDSISKKLSVILIESSITLDQAIVTADRLTNISPISNISLSRKEVELTHGGIEDPVASLAILPSATTYGGRFSSRPLSVRGGSGYETIYLLDNAMVVSPYQFNKSIFNTDVIDNLEFLSGGYPASYGQALSAVSNFSLRDGDFQKWQSDLLSYDIYHLKSLVEGPIVKEKVSMLTSVRTTHLNHILDIFTDSLSYPIINAKDVTTKFTYKANDKNQLSFTNYYSWGKLKYLEEDADRPNLFNSQSRNIQSVQWQSQFTSTLYSKLSITHSQVKNKKSRNFSNLGLRHDLTFFAGSENVIKVGGEFNRNRLDLDVVFNVPLADLNPATPDAPLKRDHNFNSTSQYWAAYALYEGNIVNRVSTNLGMRVEGNRYNFLISPRISTDIEVLPKTFIKAAWGRYSRFSMGTVQAYNPEIKPEIAIHNIVGIEQQLNNGLTGSITLYKKNYSDLFREVAPFIYSNDGRGTSKGIEILFRKSSGRFTGWVSYTSFNSSRKFGFDNEKHPWYNDHREEIVIVPAWHLINDQKGNELILQLKYRLLGGRPYTEVLRADSLSNGDFYPIIGEVNGLRYPDRHTLGLRVQGRLEFPKKSYYAYFEFVDIFFRRTPQFRTLDYGSNFENNVNEQFIRTSPLDFIPAGGFKIVFK